MKSTILLKLYNPKTNKISEMPINDIGPLLHKTLPSKILRKIILTKYFSKFTGFVLKNNTLTFLLSITKLLKKINPLIFKTYKNQNYKNFNKAFTHRHKRPLQEKNTKKILSSPADSYFNIRNIKNLQVQLFNEITLNIEKMIGKNNSKLFYNGGKFLLFTLKPFHDHTIDFPTESTVLTTPTELNKQRIKIHSTDLHYVQFASKNLKQTVFNENHRVITKLFSTAFKEKYLMIEIGAINVNSIKQNNCIKNKTYTRGTQKSHFNFGSTVILLLPKTFSDKIQFQKIYNQKKDTSVEIKRRDLLAIAKNY